MKRDINKKWKTPKQAREILYLEKIHIWKRIDLILMPFAGKASYFAKTMLVIAGHDEINIQEQSKIFFSLMCKKIIITGPIYNFEKHEILSCGTVYCFTSK